MLADYIGNRFFSGDIDSLRAMVESIDDMPKRSSFIQHIIDFLLIAWVLFMIVKAFNKAKAAAVKQEEEAPAEPEPTPADIELLTEIRDLLKEKK